jgi:crossover junction endodeoxyribonuclease RuvC
MKAVHTCMKSSQIPALPPYSPYSPCTVGRQSVMILGVDPGIHGAVAALDGREIVLLADFPMHVVAAKGRGDRAELDVHSLHALIAELGPIEHAFVERVTARPGDGSVSMFRFGQACGAIYATLAVMKIPTTFVLPRAWQRHHGIGPTPDAARQRAVQLYPQIAPQLARKADGNRADALLVACYGQAQCRQAVVPALEPV